MSFDAEATETELLHIDKGSLTAPIVLAADEGTVTFSIDVTVKGKFGAQFSFAIWDSVDRDYVSLGDEWTEEGSEGPGREGHDPSRADCLPCDEADRLRGRAGMDSLRSISGGASLVSKDIFATREPSTNLRK